jgi:hypothetical protein
MPNVWENKYWKVDLSQHFPLDKVMGGKGFVYKSALLQTRLVNVTPIIHKIRYLNDFFSHKGWVLREDWFIAKYLRKKTTT